MYSLMHYFQKQAELQNYTLNGMQQEAIKQLSELSNLLCMPKKAKNLPSFYFWGPVGRGKSWLLNTFFEAVPIKEKKRFHFHSFFKLLHQTVFKCSNSNNPTKHAIDQLVENTKLICFDEFHVYDIGDAMLITQLFKTLFERHIAIITTSNYSPDTLLSNPLYHQRFIPTITLLKKHMHVLNVTGEIDFRTLPQTIKQGFSSGYYIFPATVAQRNKHKLPLYTNKTQIILIANRQLNPVYYANNQILFNFQDICEQNTSGSDYLTLSEQFNTWIIDNVPILNTTSTSAQQRFINLIDILYDQNKCLYLLTSYSLEQLLTNSTIDDMERTRSRLTQLQKC